jgi:hypothetical protein
VTALSLNLNSSPLFLSSPIIYHAPPRMAPYFVFLTNASLHCFSLHCLRSIHFWYCLPLYVVWCLLSAVCCLLSDVFLSCVLSVLTMSLMTWLKLLLLIAWTAPSLALPLSNSFLHWLFRRPFTHQLERRWLDWITMERYER